MISNRYTKGLLAPLLLMLATNVCVPPLLLASKSPKKSTNQGFRIERLGDDGGGDASGNLQTGSPLCWLKKPLAVKITDSDGNPLPDKVVDFALVSEPPNAKYTELSDGRVTSDENGIAQTSFKSGDMTGDYVIIASLKDGVVPPIAFTITVKESNWVFLILIGLVGGASIFLFGMNISSDGVRKAAGFRMKTVLGSLTNSWPLGGLVGVLMTVFTQSSGATTVLLISFVAAELMTLSQTFAVILGANIGTTITTQLIAFNLSKYALLFVAVGFLFYFFNKRQLARYVGKTIMGFGLVFFGIKIMSDAVAPLTSYQPFLDLLVAFDNPVYGVLIGAAFTALIHASSATVGIVMAFTMHGVISLEQAIPLILGANIGTCSTALMGAFRSPGPAKQVAAIHISLKILGVLLFIWWVPLYADFIRWISGGVGVNELNIVTVPHLVANAHMIFNIVIAIVFLPFAKYIIRFVERLVPVKPDAGSEVLKVKYIDNKYLEVPVVAMSQISREVLRMGEITNGMLGALGSMYGNGSIDKLEDISAKEKKVDYLRRVIANYIMKIWQQELTPEQSRQGIILMSVVNELEHIGDVIERDLYPLLKKKYNKGLRFSSDGLKEIHDLHSKVLAHCEMALLSLTTTNLELANMVLKNKAEVARYERVYRHTHFARLMQEVPNSVATGPLHLDIIDSLKRINTYAANIAKAVLGDVYPRELEQTVTTEVT